MKLKAVDHEFLTKDVIQSLTNNHIFTVKEFLSNQPLLLSQKCSLLSFDQIFQLRAYFIQSYGPGQFGNQKSENIFPTSLLNLRKNHIYEIFGSPGSGKTQFCLTIAAQLAKTGNVLYIDTKNDFSTRRMKSILNDNVDDMKKIFICKAFDLDQAINLTEEVANIKESQQSFPPKVLILDNIASIVWPQLKDDQISELFFPIGKLVANLRKIAFRLQIPVVIVNNTTNNGTRALGKFFTKVANCRLHIANNEISTEKSLDSNYDVKFKIDITEKGVVKIET